MAELLSFDNPVFTQFLRYSAVVAGKTLLMSPLTSFMRIKNKKFANEEDMAPYKKSQLQLTTSDPLIERLRRCHQNDLENIVPFVLVGSLYVMTDPHPTIAMRIFQVFAVSRILHSAVYLGALPQPSRAMLFYLGWIVNAAMAFRVYKVGVW